MLPNIETQLLQHAIDIKTGMARQDVELVNLKNGIGDIKSERKTHDKEMGDRMDAIYEQTSKTNGRVNALEKWKMWILGAVAGVSLIFGAFWAIFGADFLFTLHLSEPQLRSIVHEEITKTEHKR
jgi:hypothetical protein